MKKAFAIFLAILLLGLTACGGNEDGNTTESAVLGTESLQKQTESAVSENRRDITLQDVINAKETPESDFEVVDHGEGIVELITYLGDDEIVVIPDTVNGMAITRIGAYVFANDYHPNVRAIRLSDSVKEINTYACALNENLEFFVAGAGLEEIKENAFFGCCALKEVVLGDSLLGIGELAFANCDSLKSIEIPACTTDIHWMAFLECADDFTIIGVVGSTAEAHAANEGLNFKAK